MQARRAVVADAPELVRLRGVMFTADGWEPEAGRWQEAAEQALRTRLAEPEPECSLAAFVVDRPDQPEWLAACVIGLIERRLGDPGNPGGEYGYVFNVATDPGYRRRGYSRSCMAAVLDWYRERGVGRVDLKTTPEAEPLYRSLGFEPSLRHLPMRLELGA